MNDEDQDRDVVGSGKIELGCGDRKVDPDSIGVDILPASGVDLVVDARDVLAALEPGSVDEIFSGTEERRLVRGHGFKQIGRTFKISHG